jgi:putative membrane protein
MWISGILALAMMAVTACDRQEDRQGARHTTGQPSTATAGTDQDFVSRACEANLAEIEAGNLAAAKGTSADVKKFAQHMVEDHSAANGELRSVAEKLNFQFPSRPDDAHQKDMARLAGMGGAEFDRKYAEMMVTDHQKAVSLFEKFSKDAKHKDLRDWADKTLPKLRDHLSMARDLSSKLGQPSAD